MTLGECFQAWKACANDGHVYFDDPDRLELGLWGGSQRLGYIHPDEILDKIPGYVADSQGCWDFDNADYRHTANATYS